MDKVLKLYCYVDGINDTPFPSSDNHATITSFKYDSKRMGGAPTISATLMHEQCLDKLWEYNVYATFNGEKYFIKNIPSSSYNNTDILYKHDIELVSERIVLDNVYFYDVVSKDVVNDKPVSNNSKFTFFGDIHEFASRLNYSLQYSKIDYTVVVDDGISSEGKFISFEDTFFSNAIQESYNTYEIPYYFDGKTIHFGFTNNAITQTFKYGADESLLSIQKQNANYKVVNRVTGTGSSDNIPYYYPNLNEWGIITAQVGWDKEGAGYDWDFGKESELELKVSDVIIVDEEKFATKISPDDRIVCYGFRWHRNTINGEEILLDDIGIKIINHDGNQGCPNSYFWFGQKRMGYAMPVQSNLMPPIYRSTEGEERFYNALNNTYISPETGTYYEFENQYTDGKQKEQIVNFEDIKPSIVGMTNAKGQRIDTFLEFAYDENDNDETDEEGNYLHPYFFAKLPKYDGTYGFNLFDHAIDEEEMTISMTSGNCGACEWTVMVDSETLKNTVQVDSDGNLLRDKNGNVSFGAAQDRQNDTINNEVWIALKKDIDTFGVVMPNVTHNYKPSAGDTFVILHILLPNSYIFAAENRLKEELIKYMAANNSEKFNFSIAFSRIYFAENPDVLDKLNENARIQIEYNGELHELYVSSFAYSMDSNSPLPNITVELSDTLAVQQNALQTAISQVEHSIMKNIGSIDWLKLGLAYFLRKDTDDRSRGKVASDKGFEVGKFVSGTSGAMIYLDKTANKTVAELDKIYVRAKAYFEQLEIVNVNSIGGKQIISTAGSIRCKAVETKDDIDYYRCYILTEQDGDKIENRFKVGDQAYCQMFNAKEGVENNISNRHYWRLVVGVGEDYIDLSKSDCDTNSDEPMANDIICQRGNRDDIDRQNFMEFSSVDSFSPSITLYQDVNDYSLVDKEVIQYGVDKTTGKGFMNIYGEMYVGDRGETTYMRYTQENGLEIRGKLVTKGGDDVENYLTSVQDYMDGLIETYYGGYTPTNDNYPSIEWSTEEEKKQHINDVFINTEEFKNEETTPNAGLTWRWSCDENGIYGWQVIADKDIANSYKNAVLANKDAIAAKNSSDEVAKAGNEIKEITDSAFADDTVTESEKNQIDSKIVIITNLKSSLQSTYSALKDNELLAGIEKTNLTNGYSSLINAINELTSSITNVMADNTITDVERALISGKFEAFYSKQGDYNKYVLSALKAIQGTINAVSIRALDELGGYAYLKKALKESTVIKNGLVQSSVVALGYTDTEGKYHIMAGTNGLVDDVLTDKTPAIWAGGGMIDKEASEENASNPDAADFLVRMDGSGYAAGGKLSWDITGKIKADPLSFFVGENIVGALLASFQVVLKADKEHPDYIIPQVPFQTLHIADRLRIGDALLKYDPVNKAIYATHVDGSTDTIGFYSEGWVSAKGANQSSGGGSGASALYQLLDVLPNASNDGVLNAANGSVLTYNGTKWQAGTIHVPTNLSEFVNDSGFITSAAIPTKLSAFTNDSGFITSASIPTSLKNPYALKFGSQSYDGSSAKTITASDLGALTSHQSIYQLTIKANDATVLTFTPNSAAGSIAFVAGSNISLSADATNKKITIANTYSYTHPSGGANVTIAAAGGKVLGAITVNSLGHVTSVSAKTLVAADVTDLADVLDDYATITYVNDELAYTNETVSALVEKVNNFLEGTDTDGIINKWKELEAFLAGQTQTSTLADLLNVKAFASTKIIAGTGLTGGGDLTADRTLSLAASGVTAGTYPKVTVDQYGRVTAGSSLLVDDIPNLPWSKITSGKPTTLTGYGITDGVNDVKVSGSGNAVTAASVSGHVLTLTKGVTFLPQSSFEDLFEKVLLSDGKTYAIRAKYGFYSDSFVSAKGLNSSSSGGGGGGASALYQLLDVLPNSAGTGVQDAVSGTVLMYNGSKWKAGIIGVPNALSQLTNDAGFITSAALPTKVSQLNNDAGYITGIDKSMVEGVLTGNITSHTHNNYVPLTGEGASGTWGINISGNATTATKLGTSTVGSQNMPIYIKSGTPTEITSFPEAYLSWGGKNFSGEFGPIDAAMIPELGACRSMFAKAAGIEVQYSRDGGATWVDYVLTDDQKSAMFSTGFNTYIGGSSEKGIDKSNYKLRVIVTTNLARIFTKLNKIAIYLSTNGCEGCYLTIDARTHENVDAGNNTWTTLANKVLLWGFPGWNIINIPDTMTYGNQKHHYQQIRFLFGVTSHPMFENFAGLFVSRIMMFGGVGWSVPSNMARNGHLYSYNSFQDATFPAKVTAKGGFIKDNSNNSYVLLGGGGHKLESSLSVSYATSAGNASTASKLNNALTLQANGTSLGTYDGSAAKTFNLTYANVGAAAAEHTHSQYLTEHQNIYSLTFTAGTFIHDIYTPNSEAKTINIPTTTSHIREGKNLYFTNQRAVDALSETLFGYQPLISDLEIIRNSASEGHTAYGWGNHANAGYLTGIDSTMVVNALGYTPYNSSNPNGYISGITKDMVENVLTGNITSHTHSYLPISGGAMTGPIKFNSPSLPNKNLYFVCGIDAFDEGGEMGWMKGSAFVAQYAPSLTGSGASGTWGINISGNATSATKLQTARTIWGQSFDGTDKISGALTEVTNITASGYVSDAGLGYVANVIQGVGWHTVARLSNWKYSADIYISNSYNYHPPQGLHIRIANGVIEVLSSGITAITKVRYVDGDVDIYYSVTNFDEFFWRVIGNGCVNADGSISTKTGGYECEVNKGVSINYNLTANGNIAATGAITAKASSSDIRLKKDISSYSAIDIIRGHRSVMYHWNEVAKANSDVFKDDNWHYGLIAQEMQEDMPQMVSDVFKDYLVINYERLIPICWKGLQEVDDEVTRLKKKVGKLEKEIRELKQGA